MKVISCGVAAAFLAVAVAGSVAVPVAAQEAATEVGRDIGTIYPDEIAPLFKAPGYSPYAGRNYPRG